MLKSDTICAIATGLGRAAIGMIRVSGPEAIEICDRYFIGKKRIKDMDTFTAAFGRIVDGGQTIDEAVVLVMKGPHTIATEDTVEIDLHGGPFVMKKVMELLIRSGVRAAEPGEFTKRAYLGGRIDMTEAEAVMDVINAETDMALRSSVEQLRGSLRQVITELREKILYNTAYIESAIDDPENYSLEGFGDTLAETAGELIRQIDGLVKSADEGRIIKEGISTAIVGRPNAGKSSVLNMLLGENRAIVTDIEGTTRDTLEEYVSLDGVLLRLIDTAGIRETEDIIEKIGVDKARESMKKADLLLIVVDGSEELKEEDREILEMAAEKKSIIILNKSDKEQVIDESLLDKILTEEMEETQGRGVGEPQSKGVEETRGRGVEEPQSKGVEETRGRGVEEPQSKGVEEKRSTDIEGPRSKDIDKNVVTLSAKTGEGIDTLKQKIKSMFFSGQLEYNDQVYITSMRHKNSLINAKASLEKVLESIDSGVGEDFYSIDLMDAYQSLGEIIGETLEDDLADKIFSEFCMGK